jgi:cytochrome d ubiquinol oxidase subunit II
MTLVGVWFAAIAVLWLGFLFLEGFDFGVALLLPVLGRTGPQRTGRAAGQQRDLMLRTIGPVWDGNEVWLITAIGATFAAFPGWYASWLSSSYLLFLLVLLGLIGRAVAFEWRHAREGGRWERGLSTVIVAGSLLASAGVGAALGVATLGLPLDAAGNRVGGSLAWLSWGAVLGAVAVVAYCLGHGALFLALKTHGPLRSAAVNVARRILPVAGLPLLAWSAIVQLRTGNALTAALWVLGPVAAGYAWWRLRSGREGHAFLGWAALLVAALGAIFAAGWPVVLHSTAGPDLTAQAATVSHRTLTVMTVLAAFGLPATIAYQAWTYWVFRRRIGTSR